MQPLRNLASFLAVLLILAVPGALGVAYFRNYSSGSGGHEHGPGMTRDHGENAKAKGSAHGVGAAHAGNKSGEMAENAAPPTGLLQIGAEGFFVDRSTDLQLESGQTEQLRAIQAKAQTETEAAAKRVASAEAQLWTLTGNASPDLSAIEAKVREIEQLRSEQRVAFIRAVAEAVKVLSPGQKQRLLGAGSRSDGAAPGAGKAEKPAETPHKH